MCTISCLNDLVRHENFIFLGWPLVVGEFLMNDLNGSTFEFGCLDCCSSSTSDVWDQVISIVFFFDK